MDVELAGGSIGCQIGSEAERAVRRREGERERERERGRDRERREREQVSKLGPVCQANQKSPFQPRIMAELQ